MKSNSTNQNISQSFNPTSTDQDLSTKYRKMAAKLALKEQN